MVMEKRKNDKDMGKYSIGTRIQNQQLTNCSCPIGNRIWIHASSLHCLNLDAQSDCFHHTISHLRILSMSTTTAACPIPSRGPQQLLQSHQPISSRLLHQHSHHIITQPNFLSHRPLRTATMTTPNTKRTQLIHHQYAPPSILTLHPQKKQKT